MVDVTGDFDALLDLDSAAVAAGVEEGRAAAAAKSTTDGFALGFVKGGELAFEVCAPSSQPLRPSVLRGLAL